LRAALHSPFSCNLYCHTRCELRAWHYQSESLRNGTSIDSISSGWYGARQLCLSSHSATLVSIDTESDYSLLIMQNAVCNNLRLPGRTLLRSTFITGHKCDCQSVLKNDPVTASKIDPLKIKNTVFVFSASTIGPLRQAQSSFWSENGPKCRSSERKKEP